MEEGEVALLKAFIAEKDLDIALLTRKVRLLEKQLSDSVKASIYYRDRQMTGAQIRR